MAGKGRSERYKYGHKPWKGMAPSALLMPLSGSEKASSLLQLIGVNDGRIGSLKGY
jgi:hypothetical protein